MLEARNTVQRLGRVHARAVTILGAELAATFIADPHPMLGGRTPLEAATTDLGAREVERILNAIEAGLPI